MTQRQNLHDAKATGDQPRKAWIKPVVQKIKAGDAEVGTRAAGDGAFTTS